MAKCHNCKSCLKIMWVENKVYYYCTLCRLVFGVSGGALVEVKDDKIINIFKARFGNVI